MSGETLTDPLLDRLSRPLRQGREEPTLGRRSALQGPEAAAVADASAGMPDMPFELAEERRPGLIRGASLPPSAPSGRAAAGRLPIGSLVYLVFIGLVAVVTIGVFFGIGFFLLAQPKPEMAAGSGTHDLAAGINPPRSGIVPRPDGRAPPTDGGAALGSGKTDLPRPSGAVALSVLPRPQPSAADEPSSLQDRSVTQGFAPIPPGREALAGAANDSAPTDHRPALKSPASEATGIAPAQPGEARAAIGHTRAPSRDGKRDPELSAAPHHKHRGHPRQHASERAAHRFSYSAQSLTPPQGWETDPFAQAGRNR